MSTASTTWGISRLVGTVPVCPPPSPPVAITASTPHAATFSACLRAPTDAIVTTPASLSAAMSSRFGARAKETTGTPAPMTAATRSPASGASALIFTPNGPLVSAAVSLIADRSSARLMVADAMMPRPPALDTAVTSFGPDTYPIALATIG
jgi:hypothetical protein